MLGFKLLSPTARGKDHYEDLHEREISSGLKDWLVEKDKLDIQKTTHLAEELAEAPVAQDTATEPLEKPEVEANSSDEEAIPSAKKLKASNVKLVT